MSNEFICIEDHNELVNSYKLQIAMRDQIITNLKEVYAHERLTANKYWSEISVLKSSTRWHEGILENERKEWQKDRYKLFCEKYDLDDKIKDLMRENNSLKNLWWWQR